VVGVLRSPSGAGLALAFAASALLAGFSWAAALSVGPFTLALPAIVTALATGRGLPRTTWAFVTALGAVAAWLLVLSGIGPLAGLTGLLVPVLCAAAYLVAFVETAGAAAAR